jgi:hypothetical protein
MNFNRSVFPTSDGSQRKKRRLPPKNRLAFQVLDFSFQALLYAYWLLEAARQDSRVSSGVRVPEPVSISPVLAL